MIILNKTKNLTFGSRQDDLFLIILLFVNLLFYFPSLNNFFLVSDGDWILRGKQFLNNPILIFSITEDGLLRPPLVLVMSIFYTFFKLNYYYYHLTNILIHAINCFLIYYLFLKISKDKTISFFSALFFSVTLLHYQAIIWIAAFPHIWATFFALLSFIFYLNKKNIYFFLSIVFYICAFLSRESLIILPLIFLLYEVLINSENSKKNIIKILSMFLLPFLLLIFYKITSVGFVGSLKFNNIFTAFKENFISLYEFFVSLSAFTMIKELQTPLQIIFSMTALILILFIIFSSLYNYYLKQNFKFNNLILFFLLASFIAILPYSFLKIFPGLGFFHRYRYFYFPLIFFSFIFGWIVKLSISQNKKSITALFVIFFITANFISIRKAEKIFSAYSDLSNEMYKFTLKKISRNTENIVFKNFPEKPFLVLSSPLNLQSLLYLKTNKPLQVFFLRNEEESLEIIKKYKGIKIINFKEFKQK